MKKDIIRRDVSEDLLSEFPEDMPPILQRIYLSRGVTTQQDLNHTLPNLMNFKSMKGIDAAISLLVDALERQQRILIVGDFDADGATSSALMVLALRDLGAGHVDFLVPNRFEFGYGLTPEIVEVALEKKPQLLVTVDNGISSIAGVKAAKDNGLKVLVTDHHLPGDELPDADAIVNPNQPHCEFPSKAACGCAVAFYVLTALRATLKEKGWFQQQGIPMPNMANYLDIVALGTVADVVPLDINNRILVAQGLARIRAGRARPGILALLDVAGKSRQRLVASDLGFAIGPRLNAAGRLDDMTLGIDCLICESPNLARDIAIELDALNRDRKHIETQMQHEAVQILGQLDLNEGGLPFGVCLYDPQWHQGVIGILASRIKDRVNRPVIAFAKSDNGEIKGSARSIAGIHIRDILDNVAARHPDVLIKFGGHAMAAGLSLKEENLEKFKLAFHDAIKGVVDESIFNPVIYTDGELHANQMTVAFAELLRNSGPWGQNFIEPLFDGVFDVVEQRVVGEKHLKMSLRPVGSQLVIDGILFNFHEALDLSSLQRVRLVYKLDINEYRGRVSQQLLVDYLEPVTVSVPELS